MRHIGWGSAAWVVGVVAISAGGCLGSTGGELLTFDAFAGGPTDAVAGAPYDFVSGRGYRVSLTTAKLHVGAVYLNRAKPTSVSSDTSCTLQGIYVAEVPGGVDIDLLSPELTKFSVPGFATSDTAQTGEVWLMGGDPYAEADAVTILDVAGAATKAGATYPFEGTVTIGDNRKLAPSNSALPGSKPICKQRIVSPIKVRIEPSAGGRLVLRVEPRGMFANVDFASLDGSSGVYRFRDDAMDQGSQALYDGLHAASGVYELEWIDGL
jgi:hypothetical protein